MSNTTKPATWNQAAIETLAINAARFLEITSGTFEPHPWLTVEQELREMSMSSIGAWITLEATGGIRFAEPGDQEHLVASDAEGA